MLYVCIAEEEADSEDAESVENAENAIVVFGDNGTVFGPKP